MFDVSFRLRCFALLLALLAGLVIAVYKESDYAEARLVAMLRPLIEERNSILYGRTWDRDFSVIQPAYESDPEGAASRYRELIGRSLALHPEIQSRFRDGIITLMYTEIDSLHAMQPFENARISVESQSRDTCLPNFLDGPSDQPPADKQTREIIRELDTIDVDPPPNGTLSSPSSAGDPSLTISADDLMSDLLNNKSTDSRRPQSRSKSQSRDVEVKYKLLHEAKLNLARAADNRQSKLALSWYETEALFSGSHPWIPWAKIDPSPSSIDEAYRWLKAPRQNCISAKDEFRRMDLSGELPCVCGDRDP
jgi:hypothetical protein